MAHFLPPHGASLKRLLRTGPIEESDRFQLGDRLQLVVKCKNKLNSSLARDEF
ncbi:MAG: hypothetical protein SXA11_13840 [Cyanobacteriota bacterium]|nr:hypothetical protein [Cyanobacteriota bacterium]